MPIRVKKTQKILPCGNIVIQYPLKISFSSNLELYNLWKNYIKSKNLMVSKEAEKWFFREFGVSNWDEWKKKNKRASENIDKQIREIIRDELGFGIRELSKWANHNMKMDLKEKDKTGDVDEKNI